jgi:DNA-binding transcriptional LysR family regulator
MDLTDIDLNQLVLFQELIVERRVSRVAEKLGISQPAVSNTLAKLRKTLGDELFLRTPAGMMPTPFAEQLSEPIGYALGMIHSGLNQQIRFDPAKATGAMTIGMTDIGETTAINLREDMESGRVDLAIGLLPQLKAGFFQRRLFTQRYVCLFRKGHPVDKKRLTLSEFRAAHHLVVVTAGTGHGKVDELIQRSGIERTVRLRVPHYVSVGHILQSSDLLATVPERLAQGLALPFGLSYVLHPVRLPEIAINAFWHAKVHRSPANQWIRSIIFELFSDC